MFFCFPVHAQERSDASTSHPTRWGVKTNMLYDVLSFVNLGVDVNIGKHWGLEAEFIAPWWDAPDHHKTAKMLNLGVEARYYWRGWSDHKTILSGPYCGLHANAGTYDICYNNSGVQGSSFIMSGAVVGYTIPIEEYWRINLAVGFGGMVTSYDHYHIVDKEPYYDILANHYSGNYTYVGPTKIELSIVWLFSQCWSR